MHTCVVLNYLYPFTRNIYLKYLKYKQHITRQLMRSLAFKDHFAIYWKLKSASWNIAYIVKIIYFLICCTVHLSKYTKPTLLFRNTVKSDLAHALNFSTAVNLSSFLFFPFNFISVSTILHFFLNNPNNCMKYDDLQQLWSW